MTSRAPDAERRGPFQRWPRTADAVLAAVLAVAAVSVSEGPGDSLVLRSPGELPPHALVIVLVGCAAVALRRRAPLGVLAFVLVAWALTLGSGASHVGGAALVATYTVGRYTPSTWRSPAAAAATALLVVADGLTDPSVPGTTWGETAFGVVVAGLLWYVGRRLRLRQERRREQEAARAAQAQRVVADERARIARELHDVVAHQVSLMTVQAGAARAVAAQDPEGSARALVAVEEAGRQALDELRHLLDVLRPANDGDGRDPQPGLAGLPALVEQVRRAGVDVILTTSGLDGGLPVRVELSAYRIVQEALTNVLKHGGPSAVVSVRLAGDHLDVEVRDPGRPAGAPVAPADPVARGGGHGLVGMRERAQLLGGRLDAGPTAGGGFRVAATLPLARGDV